MYEVLFRKRAEKSLERLPENAYQRLRRTVDNLAVSPRPPGCTKLRSRDEWRIRVGDDRIVYGIDDERRSVEILHVAHRRDVYRQG